MRGKRSKQYRKLMQQYGMHFGFREPYQVLVDAAILRDAARFKMDFVGGMSKALHGQVKPMITQCCIRHLYESEPKDSIVTNHAKAFERRRCNHHELEKPLTAFECISSVVDPKGTKNNKHRYVVACQGEELRAHLRSIPGVPLIYLKRSVMVMEPMAAATEAACDRDEKAKFRSGLKGRRNPGQDEKRKHNEGDLEDADDSDGAQSNEMSNEPQHESSSVSALNALKKKRKRGPSGPNPLSMKKPKKVAVKADISSRKNTVQSNNEIEANTAERKQKRKRRHKSGKENYTGPSVTQDTAVAINE